MSDDILLPDGGYAPIQDTVCECDHWYGEHGDAVGCDACPCPAFLADPERSTAEAIIERGGDPHGWPSHVKAAALVQSLRDRIVGEGTPVEACEVYRRGIVIHYLGFVYRLDLSPVTTADCEAVGLPF